MLQIKIKDLDNDVIHGGLITDDGDIICACCGGITEATEVFVKDTAKNYLPERFQKVYEKNKVDDCSTEIMNVYPVWIDFSDAILD